MGYFFLTGLAATPSLERAERREKHLVLATLGRQESPQQDQCVPACPDVTSSGGRSLKEH